MKNFHFAKSTHSFMTELFFCLFFFEKFQKQEKKKFQKYLKHGMERVHQHEVSFPLPGNETSS
jgi:hypothetical protein